MSNTAERKPIAEGPPGGYASGLINVALGVPGLLAAEFIREAVEAHDASSLWYIVSGCVMGYGLLFIVRGIRQLWLARGTATPERQAERALREAGDLEAEGDYEGAFELYARIVEQMPGTTYAEDAQAGIEILLKEGKLPTAESE